MAGRAGPAARAYLCCSIRRADLLSLATRAPGGPAFIVSGNAASLSPGAAAIGALSPLRVISAASVGWNKSLLKPQILRLSPRVGLAWTIPNSGQTVFRAGFGIYRQLLDNLDYRLDQTAPFNTTQSLKNVAVNGLQIVPGAPLPAGAKISPSGVQPDAYTPTVISWNLKIEQQKSA